MHTFETKKLQMKAMTQKVAQVESTYKKMQQDLNKNATPPNGGGGRNNDKHKPRLILLKLSDPLGDRGEMMICLFLSPVDFP